MIRLIPCLLLAAAPLASALEPACEPLAAAAENTARQPNRHTVVETDGLRLELIHLDGATYTSINGTWEKLPRSLLEPELAAAQAMRRGDQQMRACARLGRESVGEVSTTVYRYTVTGPDGKPHEVKMYIGGDGLVYAQSSADMKQRHRYTGITAPSLRGSR